MKLQHEFLYIVSITQDQYFQMLSDILMKKVQIRQTSFALPKIYSLSFTIGNSLISSKTFIFVFTVHNNSII